MAEMAECMCASWLKHIKRCSIVQTNWKPSFQWQMQDEDFVFEALGNVGRYLQEQGAGDVMPDESPYQTLMQTECDVIGVNISGGSNYYYAVESAFHSDGLDVNYMQRIPSKMVRIALALYCFCGARQATIAFATPNIRERQYEDLCRYLDCIREFFRQDVFVGRGINFEFELYANTNTRGVRRYDEELVRPLCWIHPLISDAADLYLRAVALRDMTIGGCRVHGSNLRLALRELHLTAEEFINRCGTYRGVLEMIEALNDAGGNRVMAIREFVSWYRHDELHGAALTLPQIRRLAEEELAGENDVAEDMIQDDRNLNGRLRVTYDILEGDVVRGEGLSMRAADRETVRLYAQRMNVESVEQLREIFGRGVNRYHETVVADEGDYDPVRYTDPFVLRGGQAVRVCGEWIGVRSPRSNWPGFVQCAHDCGFEIVEHV